MSLRCRLGLHSPTWAPTHRLSRDAWLRIRTCTRCGQPITIRRRDHR